MKYVNQMAYPDRPYVTCQFCDKEDDREGEGHHDLQ